MWSAPVDDLNNWTCHGDIFHTRPDRDHSSDTDWTDEYLYAPDVVEKDGRYYLYCYILGSKPDGKGRYIMRLSCSHRQILNYFLKFGSDIEVLEPSELRKKLSDFYNKAEEIYSE